MQSYNIINNFNLRSSQYFVIEHSAAYQQVQCLFWEAVDSLDHHNIAVRI